MIQYYLIGAAAGGLAGYFILYKLIGCSTGSCPLTANPYIAAILGAVLGLLAAGIILSSAGAAGAGEAAGSGAAGYRRITAADAKSIMDSEPEAVIADVRTQAEYASGHIPGAVLIPNETIADTMPPQLPDLDATILVYCRSGNRSAQAAKKLIAMGYTDVYDFGGINGWPFEIVTGP